MTRLARQPKRALLYIILLLLILLLLDAMITPPTLAAQATVDQTVPVEAYWRLIHAIQETTDNEQVEPAQLTTLADQLAQIESVKLTSGATIPLDHSYLLAQLRADAPDVAHIHTIADTLLAAAAAQSTPLFTQSDTAALASILARAEFRYDETPRARPAFIERLLRAWEGLLERLAGLAPNWTIQIPLGVARLFTVFAVIALAAGIAAIVVRIAAEFTAEARLTPSDADGDQPLTADAALQRAQTHSTAGDYRTAVRYLYLSTLLLLEEHGVLRYDRTLTNRETLRRVAHDPTLSATLQNVVDVFDRVWYGFEPLDEMTYRRYADAVETLKRYRQP